MNGPLTACPFCDALSRTRYPAPGERIRCPNCNEVLRTGKRTAIDSLLALNLTVPVLMIVGLSAPFLALSGGGAHSSASVIDAARAIATSDTWPLALVVGAMIIALPLLRATALLYVLIPIRLGRPAARHAAAAFRFAIELRPWAMAEIFVIGVAVALVKISGLASVSLGPGFWSFVLLAVVVLMEDMQLCERSIWDRIA
ncbi:paraquat-inducible protein A [Rhodobacteraceae bacterium NNCM2]|nr:paraquat-inducible protein A [Coraliihabitans acroporae]